MIHVLVVDDEPVILVTAKMVIEKTNPDIRCDTCESASEALEWLKRTAYDAVVADYEMPGMNGIELLKHVRDRSPLLPYILFTGRGREEVVIEALNHGADFYVQKGADPQSQFAELVSKIRHAVDRRRSQEALRDSEQVKSIILNSVKENLIYQDLECRIIWANEAAGESIGLDIEEMVGHTCFELWHGSDEPCWECPVTRAIETGTPQSATRTTPEGRTWTIRGDPVRDVRGKIVGVVKTSLEITEQEQAAKMIYWLAQFSQQNPNPVLRARRNGQIVYANDASSPLLQSWGIQPDGVLPFSLTGVIEKVIDRRASGEIEVQAGDRIYSLTISPFEQNEFANIFGLDITARKRVEHDLKESEYTARALLRAPTDAMFLTDTDGTILDANETAAQRFNTEIDDIIGKDIHGLFPTEVARSRKLNFDRVIATGESVRFEDEREGMWNDIVLYPIFDDDQRVDRIAIVARDITRQKQRELALKIKDKAIATSLNAILMMSLHGEVIYVNQAFLNLVGYGQEGDVLGRPFEEFAANPGSIREVHRILEQRGVWEGELCLNRCDHSVSYVQVSAHVITNDDDDPLLTMVSFIDITERKAVEDSLKTSEERLKLAIQGAGIGIWDFHLKRGELVMNPSWMDMIGFRAPDPQSGMEHFLALLHPDDAASVFEEFDACARGKAAMADIEHRLQRKDGRWGSFRTLGSIVEWDEEENPVRMAGISQDISERKEARDALHQQTERLRERIKELHCLYQISHLIERSTTLEEIYWGTVDLIPPAWMYPEIAGARLCIEGNEYRTSNFADTAWRLSHPVSVQGVHCGDVDVSYTEDQPFLKEEHELLATIAERLGRVIERKRALEAIFESEEALQAIKNAIDMPLQMIDRNGIILAGNEALFRHLGKIGSDVIGTCTYDYLSPQLAVSRRNFVNQVFSTGNPVRFEDERKGRTFEHIIYPVFARGRSVEYVVCVTSDITGLKAGELALRQSEKKYRHLIEALSEGIWVIDERGITTFANEHMADMLGYTPEEMHGMPLFSFMDEKEVEYCTHLMDRRRQGIKEQHDFEFIRKDGTRLFATLETGPIIDEQGTYQGAIAGVIDITDRRVAEENLKESEERLSLAIEAANLGVWDKNLLTNEVITAMHWPKLLGYETEEEIGLWQNAVHPADYERVKTIFQDHMEGRTPFAEAEYRVKKKGGGYMWVLTRGKVVLIDTDGRPLRMIGIDQDISEIRRVRDNLKKANKKLNLLSSITRHDILNQITGMRAFLALLEDFLPVNGEAGEFFRHISDTANTIRRQITFTGDYQYMGEKEAEWQRIDILVKRAAESIRLNGTRLTLTTDPVEIFGDPMLEKAFYNLLENAVTHGEHTSHIRITFNEIDPYGVIIVEDDGVGIPSGMKEDVFEKGVGKVTGYGLFLVREILDITGMSIRETGEEGRGACFEITVPPGRWRKGDSSSP